MTESKRNLENTEEIKAGTEPEKESMFYELVMKECETEIHALTRALANAMRDGNTDAICKTTESLARIKQNAMLTAANAQAILLRVIAHGRKANASPQPDSEEIAKRFIQDTRREALKRQG